MVFSLISSEEGEALSVPANTLFAKSTSFSAGRSDHC